ncbi:protein Slg1p [[Candida] jaroonii]|uniref:Protein Slg1p n=1 Tax=[Candida] jaroonii TaxID=467808 RepID=A0ACA9Y1F7_9ASCO|nr:protein Slg1p [[Candida] jaroonii]
MNFLTFFAIIVSVQGATSIGCYSSISGKKSDTFMYQSSDHCLSQCPDSPYIAMTQGNVCYCLSSKPSDETDSSDCDTDCYGYGQEKCGGSSAYSVYVGNGDASDDESSDDTSATGQSSSTSSTSSTSSASSTSSTSSSTSVTKTTSEDSSITESPTSATGEVITTSSSGGSVVVKTVTQSAEATPSSSSTSDSKSDDKSSKSTNIGPIVGGVVGGIAAVAIVAGVIFFLIRRKRAEEEEEDDEEFFDKPMVGGSIKRNNFGTGKSKKSIKSNALDMPMTNPFTHPSDPLPNSGLTDPRLNPIMLGRRRLSEGSLADETDYSRKILQVANPDGL